MLDRLSCLGRISPFVLLFSFLTFSGSVLSQDWKELHKKGKKAYTQGKYQEAYDHFVNAQRIAPQDIDLSKDIGTAAYRKGEFDKAEQIFTSTTDSDNKNLEAQKWHNIGNSQMKQKNYNGAAESYKKSLRLDPESKETRYNYAEAKRRLALQEEQQKKQDQNKDENQEGDQQENQNDQQNQNGESDQNKNDQQNKEQQNQEEKQTDENKNQSPNDSKSSIENRQAKGMNEKAADKMLEELLKKEMETKRKVQGYNKGESKQNKSGKKW